MSTSVSKLAGGGARRTPPRRRLLLASETNSRTRALKRSASATSERRSHVSSAARRRASRIVAWYRLQHGRHRREPGEPFVVSARARGSAWIAPERLPGVAVPAPDERHARETQNGETVHVGNPSLRREMMFFWISDVPPPIVSTTV
jgi:hypothetical protein